MIHLGIFGASSVHTKLVIFPLPAFRGPCVAPVTCQFKCSTTERCNLSCPLCSGACGGSSLFAILAEGDKGMEKAEDGEVLVVYVAYTTMLVLKMVRQVYPTPGRE